MTINYRQTCVLTFLSLIAMKFLALPSLLYAKSDNMTWLVVLVLMAIDIIYAFIIISLIKKSGNKNINEFMLETIGPVLTKLFLALLCAKFLFSFFILTNGLEFFIEENFYHLFNWPVFILPIVIVSSFMCYKGIRNIARVSEVFCWAIVFACVYISFRALNNVDALNFLPVFNVPFSNLSESAFTHLGWFGSSTFLFALFGKVDFSQEKKLKFWLFSIFGIVLSLLIICVFIGLFGTTCPIHNFCISDICQFSTGQTSSDELLWLVVSIWIICQVIQIALYSYCLLVCLKHLFNIKNNIAPITLNSILLVAVAYIGVKTINFENNFMLCYVPTITIITQYFLPLLLYIGHAVNKNKTKQNKQEVTNNGKETQKSV